MTGTDSATAPPGLSAPGRAAADADFADFVAGSYAALSRTAALLSGSRLTGEDLLHEALVRTYTAWGRIDRGGAAAYTRRVMVNLTTDWWRRRRYEPASVATLPERGRLDPGAAAVEDREEILERLAALTAKERAILVLRYYTDLPEAQVAEQLGCSVGTVKSTASRALTKLRAAHPDEGSTR